MQIYHYDPDTKEYIYASLARPDPLEENKFLIPAYATDKEPPTTSEKEVAIVVGSIWKVKDDYRGTKYWDDSGEHTISEIGIIPPEGSTLVPPPSEDYILVSGEWVHRPITVEEVKREAYRRIVSICPEWKQRNLLAQASILAEKGRANWTAEELAAWDAGEVIWQSIAGIRKASDDIEAMDPIPVDYTDNKWWP